MEIRLFPDYTFRVGAYSGRCQWRSTPPPALPPHTVARPSTAGYIAAALADSGAACCVGMSGVGKSMLCLQYATAQQAAYPGGVLVERIGRHYLPEVHTALVLRRWISQATDVEPVPADFPLAPTIVRALLHHAPPFLVVFDDVTDVGQLDALRSALPPQAHVLVTTNDTVVAQGLGLATVVVGAYSATEAQHAVAARMGIDPADYTQRGWVAALATHVHHHPPALALVCAYLQQTCRVPAEYPTAAAALLGRDADTLYPLLFAHLQQTTTPHTNDRVVALHPIDRRVLLSIACCASDFDVPLVLLRRLWTLSDAHLTACLERLADAGLVRASGPAVWYQHDWVRASLRAGVADPLIVQQMTERVLAALVETLTEQAKAFDYHLETTLRRQLEILLAEHERTMPGYAYALVAALAPFNRAEGLHREQLRLAERLARTCDDAYADDVALLVANAQVDCASHVGDDRATLLTNAYAVYAAASDAITALPYHPLRAQTLLCWAICATEYADVPGVDREGLLREALRHCQAILDDPHLDAALYVSCALTRANALHELARMEYPHGMELLDEAIAGCTEALAYVPTEHQQQFVVQLWGTIASLSRSAADTADVDRVALLTRALDASKTVSLYLADGHDTMHYARELMNQANIYADLAECPDVDQRAHIRRAIDLLTEALDYRTEADVPLEYAWTQHNLAVARLTESTLYHATQPESLQLARTAMYEALRYRTEAQVPTHALLSHYYLALILRASADAAPDDPARVSRYLAEGLQHIAIARRIAMADDNEFAVAGSDDIAATLLWRAAVLPGAPRGALLAQAGETVARAAAWYEAAGLSDDLGECLLTTALIAHTQHGASETTLAIVERARALTSTARFAELPVRALLIAAEISAASDDPAHRERARAYAHTAFVQARRLGHVPHQHRATTLLESLAPQG
ncbi:MAG: hypothetical protein RLZZ297_982 [Chloroflexota bacterium]